MKTIDVKFRIVKGKIHLKYINNINEDEYRQLSKELHKLVDSGIVPTLSSNVSVKIPMKSAGV